MDSAAGREIRILLLGKKGAGKSATGNTILGSHVFEEQVRDRCLTERCQSSTSIVDGHRVVVVDTPGISGTDLPEEKMTEELMKAVDVSSPGPHAFLLVMSISRFTKEEVKAVKKIQEIFGKEALKYIMILLTGGDALSGNIEAYLGEGMSKLRKCIDKCGGRYHVFNNRDQNNHRQVTTLLKKIDDMVKENGGECFTNLMYKTVEEHKTKEANLEKDKKNTQDEMKKKEEQLLEKISKIDQERKNWSLSESNLNEQLSQSSLETSEETEEEDKAHEEKGDEKGWEVYLKRVFEIEQQRKAEQARYRERMQEAELQMKIAAAQHQQKMEDERQNLELERLKMLREHKIERAMVEMNGGEGYTNSMYQIVEEQKRKEGELERQKQNIQAEMLKQEAEPQRKISIKKQEEQNKKVAAAAPEEQLAQMSLEKPIESKENIKSYRNMTLDKYYRKQEPCHSVASLRKMFEMRKKH